MNHLWKEKTKGKTEEGAYVSLWGKMVANSAMPVSKLVTVPMASCAKAKRKVQLISRSQQ